VGESRQFLCPSCGVVLNGEHPAIIGMDGVLRGPHFAVTCAVRIPAELGVYGAEWDARLELEEGCRVEFACPSCHTSFTAAFSPEWAELKMLEGGHEYVVVFNRAYGEHATFLFDYTAKRLIKTFGHATADYVAAFGKNINFFGS
jgi:hypothetical protein